MKDIEIKIELANVENEVTETVIEALNETINTLFFKFLKDGGIKPYKEDWQIKSKEQSVRNGFAEEAKQPRLGDQE